MASTFRDIIGNDADIEIVEGRETALVKDRECKWIAWREDVNDALDTPLPTTDEAYINDGPEIYADFCYLVYLYVGVGGAIEGCPLWAPEAPDLIRAAHQEFGDSGLDIPTLA